MFFVTEELLVTVTCEADICQVGVGGHGDRLLTSLSVTRY